MSAPLNINIGNKKVEEIVVDVLNRIVRTKAPSAITGAP